MREAALGLCTAVREMTIGLYDADLGGGLFKKWIGRAGQGKSDGFRMLVATNKGSRWIFVFGLPKNERSNIDKDEAEALKKLSADFPADAPLHRRRPAPPSTASAKNSYLWIPHRATSGCTWQHVAAGRYVVVSAISRWASRAAILNFSAANFPLPYHQSKLIPI